MSLRNRRAQRLVLLRCVSTRAAGGWCSQRLLPCLLGPVSAPGLPESPGHCPASWAQLRCSLLRAGAVGALGGQGQSCGDADLDSLLPMPSPAERRGSLVKAGNGHADVGMPVIKTALCMCPEVLMVRDGTWRSVWVPNTAMPVCSEHPHSARTILVGKTF